VKGDDNGFGPGIVTPPLFSFFIFHFSFFIFHFSFFIFLFANITLTVVKGQRQKKNRNGSFQHCEAQSHRLGRIEGFYFVLCILLYLKKKKKDPIPGLFSFLKNKQQNNTTNASNKSEEGEKKEHINNMK
jgi:hypothetical protein